MITKIMLISLVAYLIGSIPTGYIIVKLFKNEDIRKIGSGSTGATNVKRVMGTKWFFIVMLLDAFKGAFPVILTKMFFPEPNFLAVLAAVFVIIGHSKSIFLKFSGGKSVATGVGTLLALHWQVGLVVAVCWSLITYISKYVSLGSVIALGITPFIMKAFNAPKSYILYSIVAAIYVIYLHRENIKRLINKNESKVR